MYNERAISGVEPQPAPVVPSVGWGAIFAGTLVAVGVWFLLHLLGMGIELSAIGPDDPSSLPSPGWRANRRAA